MLERWRARCAACRTASRRAMDGVYRALGGPGKLLQDFLNGSWLGHSLHAVLVDVVIGGATVAVLLDVLRVLFGVDGLETAATWILGLVVAGRPLGAIVTGLTDFKDTRPDSRARRRRPARPHQHRRHRRSRRLAAAAPGRRARRRLLAAARRLPGRSASAATSAATSSSSTATWSTTTPSRAARRRQGVHRRSLPAAECPRTRRPRSCFGADRGDAGPARRRRPCPEGDLLPRRRTALRGQAQGRHDHLPVARLGLPPDRWLGRARPGRRRARSRMRRASTADQVELQGPHD